MIPFRLRRTPGAVDWLIATAVVMFVAGVVVAGRQDQAGTTGVPASATGAAALSPQTDPDEFYRVGDAAVARLCTTECHEADRVFTVRRSAREWDLVVRDMARRGVKGTPTELALAQRYLTWVFGFVEVNSATAEELSSVIGIPAGTAEAIVSYREARGRFADLEALLKVPGIDGRTFEEQIHALRFD